jgi:hypothetical protein
MMGWDFKEKFSFLISPNQRAESETKDERVKQRKKGTHNTTQFNKKQHRRSKNKTALYQIISFFTPPSLQLSNSASTLFSLQNLKP